MSGPELKVAFISAHGCPFSVTGENNAGGMNTYLKECLRHLGNARIKVDLFTTRHTRCTQAVRQISPSARLIHIRTDWKGGPAAGMYAHLDQFTHELRRYNRKSETAYQAVYSHYWLSGIVGEQFARQQGIPHVITFHTLANVKRRHLTGTLEHPLREDTERRLINSANRVIVWTEDEKQELINHLKAKPRQIAVIPPGVDTGTFRPINRPWARRQLGLERTDAPSIMYVGRMDAIKGIPILIRALKEIDVRPRPRVHVFGSSPTPRQKENLLSVIAEEQAQNQVKLWGAVEHSALPTIYSAADVIAVPSYYESFGMAALEAAACATPAVAANVGGLRTIVRPGSTGYLIQEQCPTPFAEKLELLLSNSFQRRRFGNSARRHAQTFNWDNAVRRISETIIDSHRPAACV